ncbi:MAG: fumarylacetoacetate hydrolase, partial [Proteobacteria bacterium]
MKLATLPNASRDGQLVVVSRDLQWAAQAPIPTLQLAIENWAENEPKLQAVYARLNAGTSADAFRFDPALAMAPLPRAYQWCDASAFLNHGTLMQKAFNLEPIDGAEQTPL